MASLMFCLTSGVNAQQMADEVAPESGSAIDLNEVGPYMSRSSPIGRSPYEHWYTENKNNMPTFEGLVIQDARTEPLEFWDDKGVDGLYLKMADYQITDGWILEIPPGGKTKAQRHLYDPGRQRNKSRPHTNEVALLS